MELLQLIICSICVSTSLGLSEADEEMTLIHFPEVLILHPGQTATFTCNTSALQYKPKDINWYKTNDNHTVKIADLQTLSNERINVCYKWALKQAVISIKNLTFNDSGDYHCQLVDIDTDKKITKSGMSRLNVTDAVSKSGSSVTNSWEGATNKPQSDSVKNAIISASIILTLLLLLISIAIVLLWNKKRNKTREPQVKHLEPPAQDPSLYTVDYGVLEFNSNPNRKSAEFCVTEQVEYASIVFPQRALF